MGKRISSERIKEYEELKAFLAYCWTHVFGFAENDSANPAKVTEEIVKKCGRNEALAGLRQAINDVIEMTQDLSDSEVHDLDRALIERGIITLSELRRWYWRKYKAILKRAEIRNETEYYLISGILCDMANDAIEEERAQLAQLLDEYESKRI